MVFRSIAIYALTTLMVLGGHASESNAAPKPVKYRNCASLNEVYPAGIALSKAAAQVAQADGKARPKISKKIYDLNKSLDRNKDLVVCEVSSSGAPAAPEPATPRISYVPTGIAIYDAINQSRADRGEISQAQSNALTRLAGAVTSPNINTRVKVCPLWGFEVFRIGYLNSAIIPESLAAIGLTPTDQDWAKENLSLAIESYCVS